MRVLSVSNGRAISRSPRASNAGIKSGDIIVGINGTRIANGDKIPSYLEENTLPGQTVALNTFRNIQTLQIPVVLGRRLPPA